METEIKKILIISGSARKKGDGFRITESLIKKFGDESNFEWEYLFLNDYEIKGCIGCRICINKNEKLCPFKDDLLNIVSKMNDADGFVVTTPVYSMAITSQMKAFIDRTNYLLHRPTMIGRPTIIISTTDLGGTRSIIKYLKHILRSIGLRYAGGLGVRMGRYRNNEVYRHKIEKKINALALIFKSSMEAGNQQRPHFKQALIFKIWQTRSMVTKDKNPYVYKYWSEKGWIDTDYFYPTKIMLSSKIIIKLFKNRVIKLMKEGFI